MLKKEMTANLQASKEKNISQIISISWIGLKNSEKGPDHWHFLVFTVSKSKSDRF